MKVRRIDYSADEMIAGVAGQLDPVDFGVYWMICTLIYSRGGPIADDAHWIAGIFRKTNPRTVRAAIDRLVSGGKVQRLGSELMVNRCRVEVERASSRVRTWTENGSKGGRPRKENKDIGEPEGSSKEIRASNHQPSTTKEEGESSLRSDSLVAAGAATDDPDPGNPPDNVAEGETTLPLPVAAEQRDEVREAVELYNAMATRAGLPGVQKLTDARRAGLRRRLKDVGGIEGWKTALQKVEASSHCRGGNDRGWRADLDFLLQESKFVLLMEGRYDDRSPLSPGVGTGCHSPAGRRGGLMEANLMAKASLERERAGERTGGGAAERPGEGDAPWSRGPPAGFDDYDKF